MSTQQQTIDFISEQVSQAGTITSRKMFGEYALYCNGKVVAFVCDDQLFIKPTEAAKKFLKTPVEKPAYPGSKMYYWIDTEYWDDETWMSELIRTNANALPAPKPKRRKASL